MGEGVFHRDEDLQRFALEPGTAHPILWSTALQEPLGGVEIYQGDTMKDHNNLTREEIQKRFDLPDYYSNRDVCAKLLQDDIGSQCIIMKLGFDPVQYATDHPDNKFAYVPLPEYGVGIMIPEAP